MVGRVRLSDAVALAAQPRERKDAIHDEKLRGFMLRVQPGGSRSWVLRFRRGSGPHRVTLGKVGAMTAYQARAAALALMAREKGDGCTGSPAPPVPASRPARPQPESSTLGTPIHPGNAQCSATYNPYLSRGICEVDRLIGSGEKLSVDGYQSQFFTC